MALMKTILKIIAVCAGIACAFYGILFFMRYLGLDTDCCLCSTFLPRDEERAV